MSEMDGENTMACEKLLKAPLWRAEDLGKVVPPTRHGISMCLPRWQDVVGYEEKDPATLEHLCVGYPRFYYHPLVAKAFEHFRGPSEESLQIYTTYAAAARCRDYLQRRFPEVGVVLRALDRFSATVVAFPSRCAEEAKAYWQHTGEGITSRYAEALLENRPFDDGAEDAQRICERVAEFTGTTPEQVYLFPSGMSAIYWVYRAMLSLRPGLPTVQFSFPYGDTLKLQKKLGGPEPVFYPRGDAADLAALEAGLASQAISGLFCEFPTNPLLSCVDLRALRRLADAYGFPLLIDETLGACINQKTLSFSDVTAISLTKFFTGSCDVMGGALIMNPASPHAESFRAMMQATYEPAANAPADLARMVEVSADCRRRIAQINETALTVCTWLQAHEAVEQLFYPAFTDRQMYDSVRCAEGGYGGLFSLVLKNPERFTARFYDALEITKGPNLGTSFSLCCPFTLLAHYEELEWAEAAGASRWLIRISVGLEPAGELIDRLDRAMRHAGIGCLA
jgi:cystathionine gamma-synthase